MIGDNIAAPSDTNRSSKGSKAALQVNTFSMPLGGGWRVNSSGEPSINQERDDNLTAHTQHLSHKNDYSRNQSSEGGKVSSSTLHHHILDFSVHKQFRVGLKIKKDFKLNNKGEKEAS